MGVVRVSMRSGAEVGDPGGGGPDLAPFDEPVGRPWGRLLLVVLVLVAVLVAVFVVDLRAFSLAALRDQVASAGAWAPVVYLLLFVVGAVVVVPGTAMMAVAALLFPLGWAFLLAWGGALAGATVCFLLARRLGRGFVRRMAGQRLSRLDGRVASRGFHLVLLLRLAGLPPFNMMNYVAGLTQMRLRDFVLGTALGILPLVAAVVAVVNRIGRTPRLVDLVTDPILYAALGLVVLVLWVAQRMKRSMDRVVDGPTGRVG